MQAFETKAQRRLLGIHYRENTTNIYITENVNCYVTTWEVYASVVGNQQKKVMLGGHVTGRNTLNATTIQQGQL